MSVNYTSVQMLNRPNREHKMNYPEIHINMKRYLTSTPTIFQLYILSMKIEYCNEVTLCAFETTFIGDIPTQPGIELVSMALWSNAAPKSNLEYLTNYIIFVVEL